MQINLAMKELLRQLAAYNLWANQKLTELVLSLPDEKQQAEVPSSFSSAFKTILHIWDAESIWWQRMRLQEYPSLPSVQFKGDIKDAVRELSQQDQLWLDWISNASDAGLDHVFQYYTLKKEPFKQPVYQVAMHVFNHSSYHRGQLVNILRQLGIEKIPTTDMIIWSRTKK